MRTTVGCLYGGLAMKFTKPSLNIKQKENPFKLGTSFNDILTLYLFDRKFRLPVFTLNSYWTYFRLYFHPRLTLYTRFHILARPQNANIQVYLSTLSQGRFNV